MLDYNGRKPLAATVMAAVTAAICLIFIVASILSYSITHSLEEYSSWNFISGRSLFVEFIVFLLMTIFIFTQAKRETKWLALPVFILTVVMYLKLRSIGFSFLFSLRDMQYGLMQPLYALNLLLFYLRTFLLFLAPFLTALAVYGLTLNKKPVYIFSGISIFVSAVSSVVNFVFYAQFFRSAVETHYGGLIVLFALTLLGEAAMNVTYILLMNALSPQKVEIKYRPGSGYGMPRRINAPQSGPEQTQKPDGATEQTQKSEAMARDASSRLAELKKLLDQNLITPEEYEKKRSRLLEEI